MASQNFLGASITGGTREKTYFEQQREALIGDIANSFEHVLANINKLNRSLEAVITVCVFPPSSRSLFLFSSVCKSSQLDTKGYVTLRLIIGWQRILLRRSPLVAV